MCHTYVYAYAYVHVYAYVYVYVYVYIYVTQTHDDKKRNHEEDCRGVGSGGDVCEVNDALEVYTV